MNEELIKMAIKTKLKLADALISRLPEDIRKPVDGAKKSLLTAANEILQEYLKEQPKKDSASGIKTMNIE